MKILFLSFLLLQAVVPQVRLGAVSGRLVTREGTPVANLRVIAIAVPDPPSTVASVIASAAQTDADGHYRLENIPPGRYYIAVGRVARPTYYPGVVETSDATIVTIASGVMRDGVDFSLVIPPTLKISGRVIREDGASPIANQVLMRKSDAFGMIARSDITSDGSFEFPNTEPGSFNLAVAGPGVGLRETLVVISEKDIVGLEILAPHAATITGSVIVEGADLVPQIRITTTPVSQKAIAETLSSVRLAATNGSISGQLPTGEFRIAVDNVSPGYRIESVRSGPTDLLRDPLKVLMSEDPLPIVVRLSISSPSQWVKFSGRVTGVEIPSEGLRLNLTGARSTFELAVHSDGTFSIPMILPGSYRGSFGPRMEPVSFVVPNRDTADVQIFLGPARTAMFALKGRIVGADPATLTRNLQLLIRSVSGAVIPAASTRTIVAADGSFQFSNLDAGTYTVAATTLPGSPEATVVVDAKDVDNVEIRVTRHLAVSGLLRVEGDAPLPRLAFTLTEATTRASRATVAPQSSGVFRVELPEGENRVAMSLPDGYRVVSFLYGATDLMAGPLKISGGDSAELRIVLSAELKPVKVSGRIKGRATAGLEVTLSTPSYVDMLRTTTRADGSFDFPKVFPGRYALRLLSDPNTAPVIVADRDVSGVELNSQN